MTSGFFWGFMTLSAIFVRKTLFVYKFDEFLAPLPPLCVNFLSEWPLSTSGKGDLNERHR